MNWQKRDSYFFGSYGEKRYFCSVILKTYTYLCSDCTSYNLFLPAFSEMQYKRRPEIDRLYSFNRLSFSCISLYFHIVGINPNRILKYIIMVECQIWKVGNREPLSFGCVVLTFDSCW